MINLSLGPPLKKTPVPFSLEPKKTPVPFLGESLVDDVAAEDGGDFVAVVVGPD